VARAQQAAMPIVGLVNIRSADASARNAAAFRKGLNETGTLEGQDVMVEYHWLDGHYDRLPAVMADLVRRRVAVIATPSFSAGAQAAKAATTFFMPCKNFKKNQAIIAPGPSGPNNSARASH
jgi:putative tryptophan/tyrosine transport system substrate-binding protein